MTILKFMFSTVLVGMVGIYLLHDLGLVSLSLKATVLGGNIIGGLIFGVGWGLVGYCPGTSLGAQSARGGSTLSGASSVCSSVPLFMLSSIHS